MRNILQDIAFMAAFTCGLTGCATTESNNANTNANLGKNNVVYVQDREVSDEELANVRGSPVPQGSYQMGMLKRQAVNNLEHKNYLIKTQAEIAVKQINSSYRH